MIKRQVPRCTPSPLPRPGVSLGPNLRGFFFLTPHPCLSQALGPDIPFGQASAGCSKVLARPPGRLCGQLGNSSGTPSSGILFTTLLPTPTPYICREAAQPLLSEYLRVLRFFLHFL